MSVYKPKTSPHWHYDFWFKGVRHCGSTGCLSRREAAKVEIDIRSDAAAAHKAGTTAVRRGMTIGEACTRYGEQVGRFHRRPDQTKWSLEWIVTTLGHDRLIGTITDKDVAECVARRRGEPVDNKAASKGRTRAETRRRAGRVAKKTIAPPRLIRPSTVNRSVTEPLRKVLNRARDVWGETVPRIDWRQHMLREPQERIRELRAGEEEALFAALPAQFHPAVRFTLATGCRLAEVVALPWSAIDWGARTIIVRGKGDKTAPIPMTARMRALLFPLQASHDAKLNPDGRVFAYADGRPLTVHGLDAAWGRALAKAAIADFRFHDLRHTAATRLLRSSGNLKAVQKLLRHEDITTTARYGHVLDEDLRREMEALDAQEVPKKVPKAAGLKRKV